MIAELGLVLLWLAAALALLQFASGLWALGGGDGQMREQPAATVRPAAVMQGVQRAIPA